MMLIIEISVGVGQLEIIQHCLNATMRVWSLIDCVLVMLNVNVNDDDLISLISYCTNLLDLVNFLTRHNIHV